MSGLNHQTVNLAPGRGFVGSNPTPSTFAITYEEEKQRAHIAQR